MIIGDTLTIDGQTYELSAEQKAAISNAWEDCLYVVREAESAHDEEVAASKKPRMCFDDGNPGQEYYLRFIEHVRSMITAEET